MTKNEYLKRLKNKLRFRMTSAELSEVISDMAECFEAGAAEGRSEEDICLSLGSPESAAAALVPESAEGSGQLSASLSENIPALFCAAAALLFTVLASCAASPLMYALPLLPPAMWLITEGKRFMPSLRGSKEDISMLIASGMIFAAGMSARQLFLQAFLNGSRSILLAMLASALTCGSMAAMLVSMIKSGKRALIFVPAAGVISAAYCLIRGYDFFCAANIDYGVTGYEAVKIRYAEQTALYCGNYLRMLIIFSASLIIWSFIGKNALTMISSALSCGICLQILTLYIDLRRLDPLDSAGFRFLENCAPAIAGLAAAAVSLVILIAAKKGHKHE